MRSRLLLLTALLAGWTPPAHAGTLLPLDAEDAVLLESGQLEMVFGAEGRFHFEPPFRDVERNYQWNAPDVAVHAGLGSRAEAQLRWEYVSIDDRGLPSENGTGDARLSTKVRVFSEGDYDLRWLPATALQFGLKLPNASLPDGLGTDETDVFGMGLLTRTFGAVRAHGNVGVGIVGNPGPTGGQDDVFLYDLALESPAIRNAGRADVSLFAEVTGVDGSRFGNNQHLIRGGARFDDGPFGGFLGVGTGLNEPSENFTIRFGIVYRLRAFSE